MSGARGGAATPAVSYRALLKHREFTALVFAQVVSGLGDQVARVALALLVLDRSGSASLSAATFAVSYLPLVFGGTLLGPLADRYARHKVLLSSDGLRVVIISLLAVLADGSVSILLLLLLLFVAELFTPVFDAAWAATLPEVLPDGRDYLVGSGLLRTLHLLQQVAGLALGGLAVALLGVRGALVVNAVTFIASFVILFLFLERRPAPVHEVETGGMFADFTAGARDLFSDPVRRMLVIVGWGSVIIMITPMAVALPYAEQVSGTASLGGLLMAATVGGAALGAVLVSRREPQWQVEAILPLSTLACLPLLGVAFSPPVPIALILWAVSGAATGFLVPLIGTIALLTAPSMRGRVMALAGAGYNGLVAVFYLSAGVMADITEPSVAITVAGVFGLLLVAIARIFWPTRAVRRAVDAAYRDAEQSFDNASSTPVDDEVIDTLFDGVPTVTSSPDDPEPEPQAPREERARERNYVPTIEIVLPESPLTNASDGGADPLGANPPGVDPLGANAPTGDFWERFGR